MTVRTDDDFRVRSTQKAGHQYHGLISDSVTLSCDQTLHYSITTEPQARKRQISFVYVIGLTYLGIKFPNSQIGALRSRDLTSVCGLDVARGRDVA